MSSKGKNSDEDIWFSDWEEEKKREKYNET